MRAFIRFAVVLFAAVLVWQLWPEPQGIDSIDDVASSSANPEEREALVDLVESTASITGEESRERGLVEGAIQAERSCRGRVVVGPEQAALAHATLQMTIGDMELQSQANADGEFQFGVPELEFDQTYSVVALVAAQSSDAQFAHLVSSGDVGVMPATGEGPTDLLVQVFRLDKVITGIVADLAGNPIEGATVESFGLPFETGPDGQYSIRGVSQFQSAQLFVRAAGFAQQERFVEFASDGDTTADFKLAPSNTLAGFVRNESGEAIAGAKIEMGGLQRYFATSDASGAYLLDHIDAQRSDITLKTTVDGYASQWEFVAMRQGEENRHDIVLQKGVRVHGRVVDEDGAGLSGVSLFLAESSSHWKRLNAKSKNDGAFEFENVRIEPYWLNVEAEGYPPLRLRLDLSDVSASEPLLLELKSGRSLQVVVTDTSGEPVSGASVIASSPAGSIRPYSKADELGFVELTGLPEVGLKVTANAEGYVRNEVAVADGATSRIEIQIEIEAAVAVQVLDDQSGEPIPEFSIRGLSPKLERGEKRIYVAHEGVNVQDANGKWRQSHGKIGDVAALRVSSSGYADFDLLRLVASHPDELVETAVRLVPEHRVYGQVLADGRPVAGARIRCETEAGLLALRSSALDGARAESREDGKYEIVGLNVNETYRVRVTLDGWQVLDTELALDPLSDSTRVDFELLKGATISGQVRDSTGAALNGARISMSPLGSLAESRVPDPSKGLVTDAEGGFEVSGVADGDYLLQFATLDGYRSYQIAGKLVRVRDGADMELDIRPSGSASIAGEIQGQVQLPETVWVQLSPSSWVYASERSDESMAPQAVLVTDGKFSFKALAAGKYSIRVDLADASTGARATGKMQVELSENENAEVTLPVELVTPR